MKTQENVRKVQQVGNRMNICLSSESLEALQAEKGDNVLAEPDPVSGKVTLSKVVPPDPDSPGPISKAEQDETPSVIENKLKSEQVPDREQNPQAEVSKFEFCTNCGSDNIEVDGNRLFCRDCDCLYEVTSEGTKVIEMSPRKKTAYSHDSVGSIDSRLQQVELDMGKLKEEYESEGKDLFADDEETEPNILQQIWAFLFGPENEEIEPGAL